MNKYQKGFIIIFLISVMIMLFNFKSDMFYYGWTLGTLIGFIGMLLINKDLSQKIKLLKRVKT